MAMTPQQAREIAQLLTDAANAADAAGSDEVEILSDLWAGADEGLAELAAAIKAPSASN